MRYCQICGQEIEKFYTIETSMAKLKACKNCYIGYKVENKKVKKIERYLEKIIDEIKKTKSEAMWKCLYEIINLLHTIPDEVLKIVIEKCRKKEE